MTPVKFANLFFNRGIFSFDGWRNRSYIYLGVLWTQGDFEIAAFSVLVDGIIYLRFYGGSFMRCVNSGADAAQK